MQRQRGELVPIGEVVAGLDDGLVPAIREATPQALHHFTQGDQVNQLVSASEADPDRGFMVRTMALCSLPRTNPGNRKEYKRVNGPFTLYMVAGGGNKLPFGNFPRLILAWLSTEAVRTPKPGAGARPVALEVYANTRDQQHQRRRSWGANPAPQSNEPAVRLHGSIDLRRR